MKLSTSLAPAASLILTFSSLSSAWPSWLPALDSLIARQATTAAPTATPTGPQTPIITNYNTGGVSVSVSGSVTLKFTGTNNGTRPTHTQFNPQDPAGSVVMLTPAATAGTQLYKILAGNTVTWGWNYTNLEATPTAVDLLITCSSVSQQWTLTQNMTVSKDKGGAATGVFSWDVGAFQLANSESPLPINQYTLLVYDADTGPSATQEAGYLSPFSGFTFGLYTPQAYTGLGQWVCSTCSSAALSDQERRALAFATVMGVVTVASFTWFVTGFGVLL